MPRRKLSPAVAGVFEKNPGSNVWYIRYRAVKGGPLIRRKVGSRQEAEDELNTAKLVKRGKLPGIIDSSAPIPEAGSEVTIATLCDLYLAELQNPNSRRYPKDQVSPPIRLRAIKKVFGDRAAISIKPKEITAWLEGMGKKPGTLNRYRSVLSGVYRYGKEQELLDVNPVRQLSQFTVKLGTPRWMQPDEEDRLRAVLNKWIDECPAQYRVRKLYLRSHPHELTLAIGTGLRKANQYGLRWDEHVDMRNRKFHLPPSMTKTGKPLNLPMIDDVHDALVELKAIQRELDEIQSEEADKERKRMVANGRVFLTTENREWWKAARKEAKVKKLRWHDLRHTFATRLMSETKNLKVVQQACGHGSIATTTRYAHVSDDELRNGMAGLNRKKST